MFFVSHNHRENEGDDDSAAKYNMYEVCSDLPSIDLYLPTAIGRDDSRLGSLPLEVGCLSREFIVNRSTNIPNRQGCYSEEGDIVVLCAYLGQLARLRDALAHDVAILIDERDQVALADQESEQEQNVIGGATIERLNVTKRVCAYFPMMRVLLWTHSPVGSSPNCGQLSG